jgi:hypothetical protein
MLLKRKKGQIVEIKRIEVEIKDIQGCFPAQIIARGSSYYIRIDPSFIRFYELQPGDEILVTITEAKREKREVTNQNDN